VAREPTAADQLPVIGSEPSRIHIIFGRWESRLGEAISRLGAKLEVSLPGNFQLVPDFRMFTGKSLRLVKPLQRRFWLRSAAITDADALAMELHDALRAGHSS